MTAATNCDGEHELYVTADSFEDIVADAEAGSTVTAAIFNFVNCIIGAGAIGLGGAIAESGGLISCAAIIFFAILVKKSLDLVVELTLDDQLNSYEDLGLAAFGQTGKLVVLASKFAYSAGCLVAYIVVIRDNSGPALQNLLYTHESSDPFYTMLNHDVWWTWVVSTLCILPLCLMRDMTPLAFSSVVSNLSMVSIVAIVAYLWWVGIGTDDGSIPDSNHTAEYTSMDSTAATSTASASDVYHHWVEIRWGGFLGNMGTFVFTFVCQHTAHLTFASLKPDIRTLDNWKTVSAVSLSATCVVSLSVGIFVYMTFWEHTKSDIFEIYPNSTVLDVAKLLLCTNMLLTFPLPFLSCRELVIAFCFPFTNQHDSDSGDFADSLGDLQEPLLQRVEQEEDAEANSFFDCEQQPDEQINDKRGVEPEEPDSDSAPDLRRMESAESGVSLADLSVLSARAIEAMNSVLLPGDERQLKLPYHIGLTCKIWFVVTGLAIASPDLGNVLDLVGCVSGTLIAFVLPGCFAIQLQGYSHTAGFILVIGGLVGSVGTVFSLKKFIKDTLA